MTDFRFIDELTRRLGEAVPPGVSRAREDIETHFRAILGKAFERMDLVSREQFQAQSAVLERCRAKLDELEKRLADIQAETGKTG
jgi:BMFP domain-containing protein YqiC